VYDVKKSHGKMQSGKLQLHEKCQEFLQKIERTMYSVLM